MRFASSLLLVLLLLFTPISLAFIEVKTTIFDLHRFSREIIIARITAIDPARRLIDAEVIEMAKGENPAKQIRLQIQEPQELLPAIRPGQPIVFFIVAMRGKTSASVHLADTWLYAEPIDTQPAAWRCLQRKDDFAPTFPGRTDSLIKLLADVKSQQAVFPSLVERRIFRDGVKEVTKLTVERPAFLCAPDVNADGRPDLLIGEASGVKLFISQGSAFVDQTHQWNLTGPATRCAWADVNADGKVDLLLGRTLWINTGSAFQRATDLPMSEEPGLLASGLVDVTGDSRPDALALRPSGELLVFENPGQIEKVWPARPPIALWKNRTALAAGFGPFSDDAVPCVIAITSNSITRHVLAGEPREADFFRLTGGRLETYPAFKENITRASATPLDIDGDGRLDVLILTDRGGLMLVNRGYGAFLVNPTVGESLQADLPAPAAPFASADLHGDKYDDLLILRPEGTLIEAGNPPFKRPR